MILKFIEPMHGKTGQGEGKNSGRVTGTPRKVIHMKLVVLFIFIISLCL